MGRINMKGVFVGFEKNEIDCIGNDGPRWINYRICGHTPAIIDTPGHNGRVRSREPDGKGESNERMMLFVPWWMLYIVLTWTNVALRIYRKRCSLFYYSALQSKCSKRKASSNMQLCIWYLWCIYPRCSIKAALGYNPRSTIEWKGDGPSTLIGSIAMLH